MEIGIHNSNFDKSERIIEKNERKINTLNCLNQQDTVFYLFDYDVRFFCLQMINGDFVNPKDCLTFLLLFVFSQ